MIESQHYNPLLLPDDRDGIYNRADSTPYDVGGCLAGTTFKGTVEDALDKLLYPYVNPKFSTFYIDGQSTSIEIGSTVTGGTKTFKWDTVTSQNIATDTISIDALIENHSNDGSIDLDIGDDVTKTAPSSHSFTIKAINTQDAEFSKDFTIRWYHRSYYGSSALETLTADDITNLQSNYLSSSYSKTYNTPENDYKWICYPKDYGEANKFIDADGGLNVAMEDPIIVTVTNAYEIDVDYYCYRTTNATSDALGIEVS